jgi:hypothetical protein
MTMRTELARLHAFELFERLCEPYEIKTMTAAFDGDVAAAGTLSVSLKNDLRGEMAVAMWRSGVPKEAFREYFSSAWDHDHHRVVDAAKNRKTLASLFRYGAFSLPGDLPERVTLWRGTSRLMLDEAVRGYSWTTDKDAACWFAMRFASYNWSALVLSAEVAKEDIALIHHGRSESEAVLLKPPSVFKIDGDQGDWQKGADRHARAHCQ